jgi:hypothetical protein
MHLILSPSLIGLIMFQNFALYANYMFSTVQRTSCALQSFYTSIQHNSFRPELVSFIKFGQLSTYQSTR